MLIEDPAGGPARTSPYAALAPVGVTPWTTHEEMQDVAFELLGRGLMSPQTQQAWNDLRSTRRRLLADLFLYDIGDAPGAEEAPAGRGDPERPAGPPPVWAARLLDDLIRFDR
ncbi:MULTISPECIES: hypothetical protein [unclassified Streptomyces]|uniref:hypothetical protein n=1 Tax=unclassified Streptomyces TaxID=2593676 RepID=UPI0022518D6B|nr:MULTISPECIES: hypothetical protein [unclassified Streptomyces]MCX4884381.1 hypothetical protein [Streptomyces sp. NBC_00847]MCX5424500.1 hypothetical protein [Streptomyces sp. NBC_00078]